LNHFRRRFQAFGRDESITSHDLFGLRMRSIRDRFPPPDHSAVIRKSMAGVEFSPGAEAIIPRIKPIRGPLDILRREIRIPLFSGKRQRFGSVRGRAHT
jgi:hypothetical protein